ncbi:MAG: hypothetical protein KC519_14625 [Anaerolineae bacterium]|nr:hypothetical protein [Anaerolineae bacterium]
MGLQRSEGTLEELLQHVDAMASELRIIRRTIETLLKKGGEEDLVPAGEGSKRSAVDVLASAPGHRQFRSANEVDRYLFDERASWEG